MKVTVELEEQEAMDFMQYRKDKAEKRTLRDSLSILAQAARSAIAPDPEKQGAYIVVDQDHADDLFNMAERIM